MPTQPATDRLDSWKEIARYLQRSVRTVQRWERDEGLPVRRHRHRTGDSVYAVAGEIDQWRERRADSRGRSEPPHGRGSTSLAVFAQRPSARHTDSRVHESYLRGRYLWHQRTPETLRAALACFERAIEHDPAFALAHLGVAEAWEAIGALDAAPPHECRPRARAAARRALELDPELGEAWAALGSQLAGYEWDWLGSERAFRRAIQVSPGYATARQWYGTLLAAQARFIEAEAEVAQAQILDPLSPTARATHGLVAHLARDHETARVRLESAIATFPEFWLLRLYLARVQAAVGDHATAIAACRVALEGSGATNAVALAHLGYALGRAGRTPEAREVRRRLRRRARGTYVSPYLEALIEIGLGDRKAALERLEAAVAVRADGLIYLRVDPVLDPLRIDPRFDVIRRTMRL
ncbi:MAG TPA: tetratricopeptide repeat protein [Thermoanaerobaculia bacterium]|nr:tetratricopeptide repeat protein [Thermoanaerobaculia bacterium]